MREELSNSSNLVLRGGHIWSLFDSESDRKIRFGIILFHPGHDRKLTSFIRSRHGRGSLPMSWLHHQVLIFHLEPSCPTLDLAATLKTTICRRCEPHVAGCCNSNWVSVSTWK